MLISHKKLREYVLSGYITADFTNINGTSIDLTLLDTILVESVPDENSHIVDPLDPESNITFKKVIIPDEGFLMRPGQFILAATNEVFNLPPFLSADYKLKSGMARCGLNHFLAGWCDPGWNNSRLTLEFKNSTEYHTIKLTKGMKCGQVVFFKHDYVPDHASYAVKGQYNNDRLVTPKKRVK